MNMKDINMRIIMTKNEQAIKLLEMLTTDEFQKFTSSEFDDIICYIIEVLKKHKEEFHTSYKSKKLT